MSEGRSWDGGNVPSVIRTKVTGMGCTVRVGSGGTLTVVGFEDGLPDWPCVVIAENEKENFFIMSAYVQGRPEGYVLANQGINSVAHDNAMKIQLGRQAACVVDNQGCCRYTIGREWTYVYRAAVLVYLQYLVTQNPFDFTERLATALDMATGLSISLEKDPASVLALCDQLIHARVAEQALRDIHGIVAPMVCRKMLDERERPTALATLVEKGGLASGYACDICNGLWDVLEKTSMYDQVLSRPNDAVRPGLQKGKLV